MVASEPYKPDTEFLVNCQCVLKRLHEAMNPTLVQAVGQVADDTVIVCVMFSVGTEKGHQ